MKGDAEAAGGRAAIAELDRAAVDAFLHAQRVARIGCHADGETYVVPVFYAYDGAALYAFSTEGRKIRMMRANPRVSVEVDEYDADGNGSWRSVILRGAYEELDGAGAARARTLLVERLARARPGASGPPAAAREGGPAVVAFRIRVEDATGRAVNRA